ncbi:MAG: bifunctional nuclease family protein [Desulfobacteraceae bacterium]|nr:bifunctional nuclease family protein [Desulfobacteraceae bacterium]MBC2756917.1 bifunctional nuclease family protein [Desulfobacteraceae bacterium]
MLHKMIIGGLAMDPSSNAPILILNSVDEDFSIPIWIGLLEAASIASVLQNISFDRPMTHDLFKNFIKTVKANVTRIEVCDLKDNTFYAKIYCVSTDGEFILDARPSDAIALALRLKAEIFVDDSVVENLKVKDGEYEIVDDSDQGKKWEKYLKDLSPEDFGKYKV